ncbi:hypothetical protein [Deinococcus roseus]|uniref:Phage protein n=1 Tax=Deinococcus roseus TaxID=392414 RepID=A0ABQ2D7D5_9DEIO|nr:hypothetical protein [Deinococcus roseus]GGJ47279.1 hypothetical protein GCM10008938_36630 [Deinococcus roseus]
MRLFRITEDGQVTVVRAKDPIQAISHYATTHGWQVPEGTVRVLKPGVWQLFGGEIEVLEVQEQPVS